MCSMALNLASENANVVSEGQQKQFCSNWARITDELFYWEKNIIMDKHNGIKEGTNSLQHGPVYITRLKADSCFTTAHCEH